MTDNSIEYKLNFVISKVSIRLSEMNFKKIGNVFRRIFENGSAIIEFQKSRGNTADALSFTVNLAVVCGPLLEIDSMTLKKARAIDGHLRKRIGILLPGKQDKWWEINAATDASALANEVADAIVDVAVPYLLRYIEPCDLMALWEAGQGPGLTNGARVRNLQRLKIILGSD